MYCTQGTHYTVPSKASPASCLTLCYPTSVIEADYRYHLILFVKIVEGFKQRRDMIWFGF